MTLKLNLFSSGMMGNNVILLVDETTSQGMLIDPSFQPEKVVKFIEQNGVQLTSILFTHGHFDHFAGLANILLKTYPIPRIGLHQADLALWQDGGGSKQFKFPIAIPKDPDMLLSHGEVIQLGEENIEIRHTPGHSPGSVIFYIPSLQTAAVGDLIFKQGVGRTDLDGGSYEALLLSIRSQVFTLPLETVLIPGHGPLTTVADEVENNPYIND